jgi:hypothetical protein
VRSKFFNDYAIFPPQQQNKIVCSQLMTVFISLILEVSLMAKQNDESWRDTTDFKNTPRLVNVKKNLK